MELAFEYFYGYSAILESEYPFTSAPKDAPFNWCQYFKLKATDVKVKTIKYSTDVKAVLQK